MSFDLGTGTAAINTILAEEANRIGSDIYSRTLHTSPWLDLTKQSAFADGMGFQQTTLVYDRAITTDDSSGNSAGATWSNIGQLNETANNFGTGLLKDTASDVNGARDTRSYVQFNKSLKKYNLHLIKDRRARRRGGDAIHTDVKICRLFAQ